MESEICHTMTTNKFGLKVSWCDDHLMPIGLWQLPKYKDTVPIFQIKMQCRRCQYSNLVSGHSLGSHMLNALIDRQSEICSIWTKSFIWCTKLPLASNVYSAASYEDISKLRHTEDTQLQLHICSHCSFNRISVICPFPKFALWCLFATPLTNCCVQHKNV